MRRGPSAGIVRAGALVLAAAMHAAIPLVAHLVDRASPDVARVTEPIAAIDVEIEPAAPAAPDPAEPDERVALAARSLEVPRSEAASSTARPAPEGEPSPEPPSTASPRAAMPPPAAGATMPPADEYGGEVAPPDPRGAPGPFGAPVWSVPGVLPGEVSRAPAAPTVVPSARPVDSDVGGAVVRDQMARNDKALGLDLPAAGTVASIVAGAVRATDTPREGRASYEVRLGPAGQVLSVRLVSSRPSDDGWGLATALAKQRLAAQVLAMTGAFAAGAVVVVDVVSKMQLPSGSGGGLIGPPPGQIGGGFAFDVTDIGARPQRLVTATFRTSPAR